MAATAACRDWIGAQQTLNELSTQKSVIKSLDNEYATYRPFVLVRNL